MTNRCELCGSTRGLEVHHIIPRCAKIESLDINDKDNLIIVCSSCHAKLTPRSYLTKYGQHKAYDSTKKMQNFWSRLSEFEDCVDVDDILDIVIDVFGEKLCKYKN